MAEPALKVTTFNAETDEPLGGVLVIAQDGSYVDSIRTYFVGDDLIPANLGPERPGTYDVTAEKAGFSRWRRFGVVVEARECGPKTVTIGAQLFPLSD